MREPDEPYAYSRAKLPRGQSHPLKRSDIDAAIGEELMPSMSTVGLSWYERFLPSPREWARWTGWPGSGPVAADEAWTPLLSSGWHEREVVIDDTWFWGVGARLSVYPIPSDRRAEMRRLLVDTGLPWAIEWIRGVAHGPETARTARARLVVYLDGDGRLQRATTS